MLKSQTAEDGRDEWARECFAAGLICSSQYSGLRSEYTDFATLAEMEAWMRGGVESFERFWGYRPTTSSLPHNVSHPWLGTVSDNQNFIGVDTAVADAWGASGLLSTNDRVRFDTYWSNFNVTSRVAEIVNSLEQRSPFALLMWHAQNALGSTYSPEQLSQNLNTFAEGIRLLRESVKDLVFVTSSEFHQIKRKGWSQEIWSDHLLLRNYRVHPLKYVVPNLKELNSHAESWAGRDLQVIDMDNDIVVTVTRIDETIVLEPNRVYRVQLL